MINVPPCVLKTASYIEKTKAELFKKYPLITPEWVNTFLEDWSFSSEKAINQFDYKITPINEALKKTIEWMIHPGNICYFYK